MQKILLGGHDLDIIKLSFPLLIHGEEGSGASFYTISLAANLYTAGFTILFLCGYEMAEKKFIEQVEKMDKNKIQFFVKERVEEFKEVLTHINEDTVIVIKNIELFAEDIFEFVSSRNKLIISGDINQCAFKDKIFEMHFDTRIFFSRLEKFDIPAMNKYEGYLLSTIGNGITKIA